MSEDVEAHRESPPQKPSVMRNPIMRTILVSESISALGSQMTFIALPWFVLMTTGSAAQMGLVFAAELLPVALLGVPSGVVVQRLGVRLTMYSCDVIRTPLVVAIPLLYVLDLLTFPAILVIVFFIGCFTAPYMSAQRLLIPEVFAADEAMVVQGNGVLEGMTRLATLVGPAVAGVLISSVGAVNVLYIDAATYVGSFLILRTGLAGLPRPKRGEEAERGILAGAKFVLTDPLLRRVTLGSLLFGFFFPPLLASLPVVTTDRFGGDPRIAGLLFAAWGAGAVVGVYGVMRYATRLPAIRLGAIGGVGLALPLWLLMMPLSWWQFGLVLLIAGTFTPMLNAPLISIIMLRAPESIRTKVMTFVMTANLLVSPIAYSLAGPALEIWGVTMVVVVVAAGTTLAALVVASLLNHDDDGPAG